MTEITPSDQFVPCHEIEPVLMTTERRTLDRAPHQSSFATFSDWAHHEARHLCERGSCATGTCRGYVDVSEWRLVEENETRFTCEFSAAFYCRCY
jgi:hypothetical protein